MIFIDTIEIDERLASHLVGPDPFLRDQLVSFRLSEFAIAAPVLKLGQPALLVAVVVSHGSWCYFDISTIVESGSGPRELAIAQRDLCGLTVRDDAAFLVACTFST
jgi:hypothetical protein